jgi:hypothetical protein
LSLFTPTSSRSSAASSAPRSVDYRDLQAGDCLTGSDLSLGSGSPFPATLNVVPCTQQHVAEVFLAATPWPLAMAYPGDIAVGNLGRDRCESAFPVYHGINADQSPLTITYVVPDSDTWSVNDRTLICIAYSGGLMDHSIKGSQQ